MSEKKRKKRPKNERWPGVVVVPARNGKGAYVTWREPFTGRRPKISLKELGFDNIAQATTWLINKSKELRQKKAAGKRTDDPSSEIHAERGRKALTEVLKDYIKAFSEARPNREDLGVEQERRLRLFREWLQSQGSRFNRGEAISKLALTEFHAFLSRQTKFVSVEGGGHRRTSERLSPNSMNGYRRATIAALNWCRRNAYVRMSASDFTESLPAFKVERVQPRSLSGDEISALVTTAASRDLEQFFASREAHKEDDAYYHAKKLALVSPALKPAPQGERKYAALAPFVLLLALTGLREAEALHLKWTDVDFTGNHFRIRSDPTDNWTVKTKQERDFGFDKNPQLQRLLAGLKLRAGKSKYVITGHDSQRPKSFSHAAWKALTDEAKVSCSPKDLRSTFATACALGSKGYDPYQLAQAMGHSVDVAQRHYIAHSKPREGNCPAEWLGAAKAIDKALTDLFGAAAINSQNAFTTA